VEVKTFALDCVAVGLTPEDHNPNIQYRVNLSSISDIFFTLGDVYLYLDNYMTSGSLTAALIPSFLLLDNSNNIQRLLVK
jgi:hypothetical protein